MALPVTQTYRLGHRTLEQRDGLRRPARAGVGRGKRAGQLEDDGGQVRRLTET